MNTVLFVRKRKKIFAIVLLILFLVNLVIPYSIAFADLQHKQVLPQETPEHQQVTPQEVPEHQQVEPEKKNTQVQETEKKETPFWENVINFPDTSEYKALKAIFNDLYIAKIGSVESIADELGKDIPSKWTLGTTAYTSISAILRGYLGINVEGTGWAQKTLDIWDTVDKSITFTSYVDWTKVRASGSQLFRNTNVFGLRLVEGGGLTGSAGGIIRYSDIINMGSLGTFGKVAGWMGVALSGYEMVSGLAQAFNAEDVQKQADGVLKGIAGFGGIGFAAAPLLLTAGIVGAPAAVAIGLGGLAIYAFGTAGKYFTKNKSFRNFVSAPVRGIKKLFS